MKLIWTKAYWLKTFEAVLVTFAVTLGGTGVFDGGIPNLHAVYAALITAGMAAVYVLIKAVGGSEVLTSMGAKHAAVTEKPPTNQF